MANGKARPLFALGEWGRHSRKKEEITLRITMSCVSSYEMIRGNRFISRFAPG